ncbi:MAG TPA: hypothetical protein VNC78_02960 [Actinomycetota bacterium]|nr:hypothetical protein [Actinomycetota bacterium]
MRGTESLVLFFGIFWAAVLNGVSRYHPWETQLLRRAGQARIWARFAASVAIIDLLPLAWLWFLASRFVSTERDGWAMVSGAAAALSVFGFGRLLHSVLMTERWPWFYTLEEYEAALRRWDRLPGSNDFLDHFLGACFYFVFYPTVAYVIARLL